jgi:uncharacterized protein (DUF849 family)
MLKACLNGARRPSDHPCCPITPAELAIAGADAVAAGAAALHVHPRGDDGAETLDGASIAAAMDALRAAVAVPIGVSTGAWFLPDPDDRLRAIDGWTALPDFASVNIHEAGALRIADALLDRGVGVEAGIWTADAARTLVDSGLAARCLRFLFEPMEQDVDAALANVGAIERALTGVAPTVPRLLHGIFATAWPVLDHAMAHGYDTRIGLEDTLVRPDGTEARDNADLVRTAIRRSGVTPEG